MQIRNFPVPRRKFVQFLEVFHRYDCRFLANPRIDAQNLIRVSFSTQRYREFSEDWNRLITPIKEKRAGRMKTWLRRLSLFFRS